MRGGSSAGILLLLVAVAGLVALFSGNLDRLIHAIGAPAGGASGLDGQPAATAPAAAVQDRSPAPAASSPATPRHLPEGA